MGIKEQLLGDNCYEPVHEFYGIPNHIKCTNQILRFIYLIMHIYNKNSARISAYCFLDKSLNCEYI